MPVKNILGCKYGRLLVIKRAKNNKYGDAMWFCKCDCGNEVITLGSNLRSGHSRSCGCIQKEVASKMGNETWSERFGHKPVWNKSLKYATEIEKIIRKVYFAMKSRCYNKNNNEYNRYGGRGIKICDEWLNAQNFLNWSLNSGYKKGLTIDRIDNDGDYSPDNCRWVTRAEQNRNTSRVHIVVDGSGNRYTCAEISRLIGVSRSTAAKWFREEGLRTLDDFYIRVEKMAR